MEQLRKKWIGYSILAYFSGLGILQPLIAHGFTGDHDVALTFPQLVMHTVSLMVFSLLLCFAQNRALQVLFKRKPLENGWAFVVFVPPAFWLGYYTLYIPFDILFMLLTIGIITAAGTKKHAEQPGKWYFQVLLSMFCGALAGIASGITAYVLFVKDMKGLAGDFAIWLFIGLPAGSVSSLVLSFFMKKQFGTAGASR